MLLLQFKADEGVENCKEMEHFKCMTTNFWKIAIRTTKDKELLTIVSRMI